VEDAVEMVTLVLHDPSVKALYFALDDLAVEAGSPVADTQVPRHDAAQPRNREAALPAERALAPKKLDHWVDQYRQILCAVARHLGDPLLRNAKDDEPSRLVDLRSREAGAAGVLHRFDHVLDQLTYPRRGWIGDRAGGSSQDRMPHPRDLQKSHG